MVRSNAISWNIRRSEFLSLTTCTYLTGDVNWQEDEAKKLQNYHSLKI